MAIYLLVGVGGMAGALLRYGLAALIGSGWGGAFPAATLIANYIGCFLLPFLTVKLSRHFSMNVQKAITSGVIGSFTTFSAFSVETVLLVQSGAFFHACLYVFLSIAGGLLFVRLGSKRRKPV